MSLVNDVLKDLNQRHAQERMALHTSNVNMPPPKARLILWLLLAMAWTICIALTTFIIFQQYSSKNQTFELPEELFLIDKEDTSSSQGASNFDRFNYLENENESELIGNESLSKNVVANARSIKIKPSKETELKNKKIKLVTQSKQSKAVDAAIKSMNSGDTQKAKLMLTQAPKTIRKEINLRLMMKENPGEVLNYIKENYQGYLFRPDLLAIAAQAQQRSHDHLAAISIYKKLIKMQPRDARWRAGMAISLEAVGEVKGAKKLYELALSMPNLPRALLVYSQARLKVLL
ncbi:MAG: hypothetical protein V7785_15710 [Bermanella sp.]